MAKRFLIRAKEEAYCSSRSPLRKAEEEGRREERNGQKDAVKSTRQKKKRANKKKRNPEEKHTKKPRCGWTPNRTMFFRPFAKIFPHPNVGWSGPAHEKKSDRRQELFLANDANVFRLFYLMSAFTPLRFFLFPQKLSGRPALGRADPTLGPTKPRRKLPENIGLFDVYPRPFFFRSRRVTPRMPLKTGLRIITEFYVKGILSSISNTSFPEFYVIRTGHGEQESNELVK